ncbi:recombinase RecT [Eubacteriales bacterium OttesenSCG-928-A19]|nr:recombinase RecT [Eubacteriales bacterium OttesenSCG-928-A19]
MNNAVAQRPKFSVAIQTDGYKKLINNTLQDPKRAQRFIASVSSAVAVNPSLQECDAGTILSCALLGESLELSPSPQLGQYYMVPFKDNKAGRTVATFILGYKGYIQLAIRSGQYKKLNVLAVKQGELVRFDPLNEEIEVSLIQDEIAREAAPTIGYYAMFEYVNGFKKAMYWSKDRMVQHATRYSAAFGPAPAKGKYPGRASYEDYLAGNYNKGDEWAYSSFWYKDFDGMAYKTMLRQLISKWGIMSIEMRQAFEGDDSVINADGTAEFVGETDVDLPPMISANEPQEAVDAAANEVAEPISMSDL